MCTCPFSTSTTHHTAPNDNPTGTYTSNRLHTAKLTAHLFTHPAHAHLQQQTAVLICCCYNTLPSPTSTPTTTHGSHVGGKHYRLPQRTVLQRLNRHNTKGQQNCQRPALFQRNFALQPRRCAVHAILAPLVPLCVWSTTIPHPVVLPK